MKKIFLLIFLCLINTVFAIQPNPSEFYGTVIINGQSAPDGYSIKLYDSEGNDITQGNPKTISGWYSAMSLSDDPETSGIEGAKEGEKLALYINEQSINITLVHRTGSIQRYDAVIPSQAALVCSNDKDCNDRNICTEDSCIDGECKYFNEPSSFECDNAYEEYSCYWGNELGDDIAKRSIYYRCDGRGSCKKKVSEWDVHEFCASKQYCYGFGESKDSSKFYCKDGPIKGASGGDDISSADQDITAMAAFNINPTEFNKPKQIIKKNPPKNSLISGEILLLLPLGFLVALVFGMIVGLIIVRNNNCKKKRNLPPL